MLPPMAEPSFAVVSPEGLTRVPVPPARNRLGDSNGKTVCEVWDWPYRGDLIFESLRGELLARHRSVNQARGHVQNHRQGPPVSRRALRRG